MACVDEFSFCKGNVPLELTALHPSANISCARAGYPSNNCLLDALDPLFAMLSDVYMKDMVATFGTSHYYQADGFFNNKEGPWYTKQHHPPHSNQTAPPEMNKEEQDAQPPSIDHDAFLHSQAAYAGMARTDPDVRTNLASLTLSRTALVMG